METKPGLAISIIECDMQVDFAAPVGYVEPNKKGNDKNLSKEQDAPTIHPELIVPVKESFPGEGNRPDGRPIKKSKNQANSCPAIPAELKKGVPDLSWDKRKITFVRNRPSSTNDSQKTGKDEDFKPFVGGGKTLRQKKN